MYFLTHGESIKGAGLHVGISPTYAYEFFRKPEVQARLLELREHLNEKTLEALNQSVCTREFIDERLAAIIADPRTSAKDQIAALRLAADVAGLTDKKAQVQQTTFIATQSIQNGPYLAERFRELNQQGGYRSEHLTLSLPAAAPTHEVPK